LATESVGWIEVATVTRGFHGWISTCDATKVLRMASRAPTQLL
jgi:hypothetical protein